MVERASDLQLGGGDDEISLSDILSALKRRKLLIAAVVTAVTTGAFLYAVLTKPLYTASITVMPAAHSGGTLGKLGGGLASAAALAGFSLGPTGTDEQEYIATLKSRDLAQKFIKTHNLLPELFPERWDAEKRQWRSVAKGGMRVWLSRILAQISGDEGWRVRTSPVPSDGEAFQVFNAIRVIETDAETGLVTISFEFRDPQLSAVWANEYIAMANEVIRQRTIIEASKALEYLDAQVQKTMISGLRDTLYSLVERQLETVTLANARQDYAFRIVDPAVVPEQRSSPKRPLILAMSIILGLGLGMFIALIVSAAKGDLGRTSAKSVRHI